MEKENFMLAFTVSFVIIIVALKIVETCTSQEISDGLKKEIDKDEYLRS
jgi:hypothetical protein